jgi:hypothetical protein
MYTHSNLADTIPDLMVVVEFRGGGIRNSKFKKINGILSLDWKLPGFY